jgi:hypothetical protein
MLILTDIKKFQKHNLLEIFFSFDLAFFKKVCYLVCFTDLHFGTFCDEINFENFKKSPKNQAQGSKISNSYSHDIFI